MNNMNTGYGEFLFTLSICYLLSKNVFLKGEFEKCHPEHVSMNSQFELIRHGDMVHLPKMGKLSKV